MAKSHRKLPPGMRKRGNVYYAWFRSNGQLIRKRLSSDFRTAKIMLNDMRARADRADLGVLNNSYPWSKLRFMRRTLSALNARRLLPPSNTTYVSEPPSVMGRDPPNL